MSIAAIEKNGITLNVHPEGRLDTLRAPLLDQELQPHLAGVSQVVMDFSNVLYVSSIMLFICPVHGEETAVNASAAPTLSLNVDPTGRTEGFSAVLYE